MATLRLTYIGSACLILLFLFILFHENVHAQIQEVYRIETVDGDVLTGILVSEDGEEVVIRTENLGEITILRSSIRRMTRLDPDRIRNGRFWGENPQGTRYLFAPNAIPLGKGRGYYQNTWILFNNVNYGMSENFSLGAGIVPLFLFGVSETPVWLLPKYTLPLGIEDFYVAAGAMLGGVVGSGLEAAGLFYGTSTYGNTDKNLTVGVGYGYAGGEISDTPMVNISGMLRSSRTIYFISENYFFPATEFNGLVSFGVRWAPENFALDLALFRPLEEAGNLIGIPWLGVTIPFGR